MVEICIGLACVLQMGCLALIKLSIISDQPIAYIEMDQLVRVHHGCSILTWDP